MFETLRAYMRCLDRVIGTLVPTYYYFADVCEYLYKYISKRYQMDTKSFFDYVTFVDQFSDVNLFTIINSINRRFLVEILN